MTLEERVESAYKVADEYAKLYTDGGIVIPTKDQKIIDKYIDMGVITYRTKKKGELSRKLYFPVLESTEWDGLSGKLWLHTMHHVMSKYGISSGLSQNSVNEYISRPYRYNIDHGVLTAKYVGDKQVKEELDILKRIILKEEEND